jgi:hypothetical protein
MLTVVKTYVEESSTKIRFPFNERKNADIKCFLKDMEAIWGNAWSPNWNDGSFCWEIHHLQDCYKGRTFFCLPEFLSNPRDIFHLEFIIGSHDAIVYPRPIGRRFYNSETQEISCHFETNASLFDQQNTSLSQPSTPPRVVRVGERPITPPTTPRIAKRVKFEESSTAPGIAADAALSSKQQSFLDSALSGKNVFLTGAAGTGKTFVINEVVRRLRGQGKQVAVTSSTGNTAVAIEGQTLYSLIGCGLCESTQDLRKMWARKDMWRSIEVLIVDEISMIQVRSQCCACDRLFHFIEPY